MKAASAVFEGSAPDLDACPRETLPEIALVGRSNVGKSTLINHITGMPHLARVSDTPGSTRLLHFYTIDRRWRLVDMPGYGFAKTSQAERFQYSRLIEDYLLKRGRLVCVMVLVDSSIPPQAVDLDFVHWIGRHGRPFVIVFTKQDKARGKSAFEHRDQFLAATSEWLGEPPQTFMTSAKSRIGLRDLRQALLESVRESAAFDEGTR